MTTIESERPPINQKAIHVDADNFSALVAEMGDDALYQRFTVHGRDEGHANADSGPTTIEAESRAPIDVAPELLTEFSFGSPDSPAVEKWLTENSIQPGEEVVVRIVGKDGITEKKVSTNRDTFFVPVDKLVRIETDEFDHAEIVPNKYPVGAKVIVGRNVYDSEGVATGEKTPDTGWEVIGYGEKNGVPTTKIRKIEGNQVLSKEPTNAELEEMQSTYGPEVVMPRISEAIVRKTGHQEVKSAGIIEPVASEEQPELNEATQPKEATSEPAVIQLAEAETIPVSEGKTTVEIQKEISALPIEVQRKVTEYKSLRYFADSDKKANNLTKDGQLARKRANDILSLLPSTVRQLAETSYELEHPS